MRIPRVYASDEQQLYSDLSTTEGNLLQNFTLTVIAWAIPIIVVGKILRSNWISPMTELKFVFAGMLRQQNYTSNV